VVKYLKTEKDYLLEYYADKNLIKILKFKELSKDIRELEPSALGKFPQCLLGHVEDTIRRAVGLALELSVRYALRDLGYKLPLAMRA